MLIKTKGYEQRWMKHINHYIPREIVEIAKKYPNPIILMENLHRFTNIRWNFYQLRQMIDYKADLEGVKTAIINPMYTSITCIKCGYADKENRSGINFKCLKCGSQYNADFVGAYNIACNINT